MAEIPKPEFGQWHGTLFQRTAMMYFVWLIGTRLYHFTVCLGNKFGKSETLALIRVACHFSPKENIY